MCGEKLNALLVAGSLMGSPPHVRGKVPEYLGGDRIMRITPACAGKRQEDGRKGRLDTDHPRMCGEKLSSKLFAA